MSALPYDRLPEFVWPGAGLLLLICAAAFAYRFVVQQIVVAGRELARRPREPR